MLWLILSIIVQIDIVEHVLIKLFNTRFEVQSTLQSSRVLSFDATCVSLKIFPRLKAA